MKALKSGDWVLQEGDADEGSDGVMVSGYTGEGPKVW